MEMSESVNRLYPYDNSLVERVHQLFISGNLYPPDYYEIFNLSNANMIIHILRKFYDMKGCYGYLPGKNFCVDAKIP